MIDDRLCRLRAARFIDDFRSSAASRRINCADKILAEPPCLDLRREIFMRR
jgi:hypothetical protein